MKQTGREEGTYIDGHGDRVQRRARRFTGYFRPGRFGTTWFGKERPSRALLTDEAGSLSPAISVLLMVAITVVLGATIFVLVSDIGYTANGPCAP